MSRLLILLLLSLSSHVCNAPHLRNDHGKDMEDLKHDRTSTPLKPVQYSYPGLHSQQHQPMIAKDGVDERLGSATTKDRSDAEALPRDVKGTSGSVSGNKSFMPSSDVGLRQKTKLEETGRRGQSMLGSGFDVYESIESDETDVDEDVVSMELDYQQPHSKPPIHNP